MDGAGTVSREFAFTDREFEFLKEFFYTRTGIVLVERKREMVYGRLARRIRALGLKSFKQYLDYVQTPEGDAEIGLMINAVTTNLTKFFREPHHFEHLREVAIPAALDRCRQDGNRRIRLWSAGCSSGEEPYCMAITACDAIPNIRSWDIRILATDLDSNMLQKGRKGTYQGEMIEGFPPNMRKQWTSLADRRMQSRQDGRTSARVQMNQKLIDMITFNQLNLMQSWPMKRKFDVIFCRNVMIYFDMETKNKLVQRYADTLHEGGILYVGHSESFPQGIPNFRPAGRTCYQKNSQ